MNIVCGQLQHNYDSGKHYDSQGEGGGDGSSGGSG